MLSLPARVAEVAAHRLPDLIRLFVIWQRRRRGQHGAAAPGGGAALCLWPSDSDSVCLSALSLSFALGRLHAAVVVARDRVERPLGASGDGARADVGVVEEVLGAAVCRPATLAEALLADGSSGILL